MPSSNAERVRKRRETLRAQGLRPVQIWVHDSRRPGFEEECRRQAALIAKADREDEDLMAFMDAVFEDWAEELDEWE